MKFVTYNIQYGKGRDGRVDLARIASEVSGAEVIALQEVDRYWPHTGMTDQVALLVCNLPDYTGSTGLEWIFIGREACPRTISDGNSATSS